MEIHASSKFGKVWCVILFLCVSCVNLYFPDSVRSKYSNIRVNMRNNVSVMSKHGLQHHAMTRAAKCVWQHLAHYSTTLISHSHTKQAAVQSKQKESPGSTRQEQHNTNRHLLEARKTKLSFANFSFIHTCFLVFCALSSLEVRWLVVMRSQWLSTAFWVQPFWNCHPSPWETEHVGNRSNGSACTIWYTWRCLAAFV